MQVAPAVLLVPLCLLCSCTSSGESELKSFRCLGTGEKGVEETATFTYSAKEERITLVSSTDATGASTVIGKSYPAYLAGGVLSWKISELSGAEGLSTIPQIHNFLNIRTMKLSIRGDSGFKNELACDKI